MSAPGATILVVDDEPPIRRFLRTSLGAHGYRIAEAATGREALGRLAGAEPDLVILDLGLPDVDGLELLRMIRAVSAVPVIIA